MNFPVHHFLMMCVGNYVKILSLETPITRISKLKRGISMDVFDKTMKELKNLFR